jgi:caa(3)-type oxidase subunit IV
MPPTQEGDGPLRVGWLVFLVLAVLTVVEFIVAVTVTANLPILVVFAVAKAGLIMYYFMHLLKIWRGAEEEN